MSQISRVARIPAAVLAVTAVAMLGGCSWFSKGPKGDYALAAEERPLEVPPDLTLPDTAGAMALPPASAQARPQAAGAAPASSPSGFTMAGTRDAAFDQVGTALAGIEGVTIASKAQLLGTFDVDYQGSKFLVRVVAVQGGAYVSAVDPRGVPATDAAAVQLVAALKAKLGGR
jgi:uncharacterized lipoprotein